jgi:hypothetical protein
MPTARQSTAASTWRFVYDDRQFIVDSVAVSPSGFRDADQSSTGSPRVIEPDGGHPAASPTDFPGIRSALAQGGGGTGSAVVGGDSVVVVVVSVVVVASVVVVVA